MCKEPETPLGGTPPKGEPLLFRMLEYVVGILLVVIMAALAAFLVILTIRMPDFSDTIALQTEFLTKVAQMEAAQQQYDSQPSSITQQVEIYTTQDSAHLTDQSQDREDENPPGR